MKSRSSKQKMTGSDAPPKYWLMDVWHGEALLGTYCATSVAAGLSFAEHVSEGAADRADFHNMWCRRAANRGVEYGFGLPPEDDSAAGRSFAGEVPPEGLAEFARMRANRPDAPRRRIIFKPTYRPPRPNPAPGDVPGAADGPGPDAADKRAGGDKPAS